MDSTPSVSPRGESSDEHETLKREKGRPSFVVSQEALKALSEKYSRNDPNYRREYHLSYYHAKLRKDVSCPCCHMILASAYNLKLHQERNRKCKKVRELNLKLEAIET